MGGVGAVLQDLLVCNKRLPRCGAHSCSTVAIILSSLAVLAICFVYFDLAVAPTSLLLRGQGVFYAPESAAASGPVASTDDTKEPGIIGVDDELRPLPPIDEQDIPLVHRATESSPSPLPSPQQEDAQPCSSAPAPTDGQETGTTEAPPKNSRTGSRPLPPPSSPRTCDFYSGRWERDNTSYPLYAVQDCLFADGGFRCQANKRPDREYEQWRWQPDGCDLPRFHPKQVLERLRGSRLVFVGDSLGRNQWESMLCMLASGVANKSTVYEVNGNPITKHSGYLRFRFQDWNLSVEYYRSPYLVSQGRAPAKHPREVKSTLKLDQMDWTSRMWQDADVLVFNAGHWWTDSKTIHVGIYFQEGQEVKMSMDIREAFTKSLRTWSSWLKRKVDQSRTRVFFRGFESVHFRGGTWKRGGQCHLDTQPFGIEEQTFGDPWTNDVIVQELRSVQHVTYLNITRLTDYRKDAHPSIWCSIPPAALNRQDCSHWCLPGVPDSWNEILVAELMESQGVS